MLPGIVVTNAIVLSDPVNQRRRGDMSIENAFPAVVVIGGLFASTLLTLVLVPVLYTLIERARGWRGRRPSGRRHGGQHAAARPVTPSPRDRATH